MTILRYLVLSVLLAVSQMTIAAPSSDLSTLLDKSKTMQANFIQVVYDNKGKAVQTSHGRMAIQRPGKFRWEITRPIPQLIVANEPRLWIYDPDLEQVTIRSLSQAAGEAPALFLSHTENDFDHHFKVSEAPAKTLDWRWFSITPKKADSMFQEVRLGFYQTEIREMDLTDHLGHTTKITFSKIIANGALSPGLFIFHPPAGVDVIDEAATKKH